MQELLLANFISPGEISDPFGHKHEWQSALVHIFIMYM